MPSWKGQADLLLVQACFDLAALLRWREALRFDGPVFAGVLVVSSIAMAKALVEATDEIDLPAALVDRLGRDPDEGVEAACSLMQEIRASGAFAGVHLVPVGRYRTVAARLEESGWRRGR